MFKTGRGNRMKVIDKLAWLCIKDDKILVARSKGREAFYIPGGKREQGESDKQALIREIKEELSVDLIPETIKFAEIFKAQAHGKDVGTQVKMTCYFADFTGSLEADNEIEKFAWLSYEDKSSCSLVSQHIIDWLESERLIESSSFTCGM